ncbi:arfaptin-2-like isoform X2 [Oratosquilla oratoria]|uniref:arfaptin-2-like isoform X2 n=1 Tax=Oratosquilla oratoria TaxID=337810 RepID=UPI003F760ED9
MKKLMKFYTASLTFMAGHGIGAMDGDLSEGGMQNVVLNDTAAPLGSTQPPPLPPSSATNNSANVGLGGGGGQPAGGVVGQPPPPQLQSPQQQQQQPQRPNSLPQYNPVPAASYGSPGSTATSPVAQSVLTLLCLGMDPLSPSDGRVCVPTREVPLTSPGSGSENGSAVVRPPQSKMDTIKTWSIATYKCTRQLISEKLGKSSRTVDSELEGQIESLRETQRKYSHILRLARALSSHFYHVVQTQQQLGDAFADLAQKSPELQEEFIYNAETQRTLTKNGETLLGALNFFVSSVNTLCNKTMEDTLLTVKLYETARIEYDAYRSDLEALTQQPRTEVSSIKLEEAQRQFNAQKVQYDRLRADVAIKLKFLDENKVKVMHKQLLLFHNAVSSYFTGNQTALEATLKQFNIKLRTPNSSPPSWLEQSVPETFQSIFGSVHSPSK